MWGSGCLEFGFHSPTVYFPLIVEEALMIEPTETESLQTLEALAEALEQIAAEAAAGVPLGEAPRTTPVRRVDEARAARTLVPTFDARSAPVIVPLRSRRAGARGAIRATLAGRVVLDTTRALYVWESPYYPQFYIPLGDVDHDLLVDDHHAQRVRRGHTQLYSLAVGDVVRPGAVRVYTDSVVEGLSGTARFEWAALDSWFEEDEEVYVHPRSPYVRVDALRSTRRVRVELEGVGAGRRPRRRSWCSRRVCPPATTSTGPRWTSPTWWRPRRSPPAPTRARRAPTGR